MDDHSSPGLKPMGYSGHFNKASIYGKKDKEKQGS
jgi:hypothetical protein